MKPTTTIELPKDLLATAWTGEGRDSLTGAYVDAAARRIYVCNGRGMAFHPIPGEAPVKPAYITAEKFKEAKKTLRKKSDKLILDFAEGTLCGIPLDPPDARGNLPNYASVIPEEPAVYRAIFDPQLLLDVANSMGLSGEPGFIELLCPADGRIAFTIRHKDAFGILMPGTRDGNYGGLTDHGKAAPKRSGNKPDAKQSDELSKLRTELYLANESRKAMAAEIEELKKRHGSPDGQPASAKPAKPAADTPKEVPLATCPPTLTRNEERNGIELRFDGKPDDATRAAMKAHGFRWCPGQPGKPWVAKYSEENWVFAHSLAEGHGIPAPEPGEPEEAPPIRSAVIHGGETITKEDLAKRLFSGRDGKIPTPAELEAERAAKLREAAKGFLEGF